MSAQPNEEPEQETAETFIVQYRVKSKSSKAWGAWTIHRDYLRAETAAVECGKKRMAARKNVKSDEEWRVLHVTQEVVF